MLKVFSFLAFFIAFEAYASSLEASSLVLYTISTFTTFIAESISFGGRGAALAEWDIVVPNFTEDEPLL